MLKLARWSTTHRLYIAIGWVVLLIGVNVIAQSSGGASYSNNFTIPSSDAQRAADLLQRSFPEVLFLDGLYAIALTAMLVSPSAAWAGQP